MSNLIETKYFSFSDLKKTEAEESIAGQIAHQYMTIYRNCITKAKPVILELGTQRGQSTAVFLQICSENGGHVYSVDIDDCSDISDSSDWTFIRSDSTDVENIIKNAPELINGIDVLLIDSLHKRSHVEKEFWNWLELLNEGALIIFDDVDPHNYRKKSRKDDVYAEFYWEDIQEFVFEVFRQNELKLSLEMHYGSSGLAIMTKRTPKGDSLNRVKKITYRTRSVVWKIFMKISHLKHLLKCLIFRR